MSVLTISTLNNEPEIRNNLFKEINFLSREGIKVNLEERLAGRFFFLNCSVDEDDSEEIQHSHEKILRYYLSNVITDVLMNQVSKIFMNRILKHRYHCFDEDELNRIIQNAFSYLNNLYDEGDISLTLSRHHQVFTEVSHYLDDNNNLYLEGFLRFRLKDYFQEIIDSVERAVDNFLMEKEYLEFIQLLRYFVDIQQPKIDEVHVLIQGKNEIYFLDEANQPVKPDQIRGILTDFEDEIDYEDWMLSALITIAPRRIILHILKHSDLIETITSVFVNRVMVCQGCILCQHKEEPTTFATPFLKPIH